MKLGPYELGPNDTPKNGVYCGDSRELAKAIPDESVDLIFTDPVYQNIEDYRWLAETAARVLRQDRACLVWQSDKLLPQTFKAIEGLCYERVLIWYQSNNRSNDGHVLPLFVPLLWFMKGAYKPRYAIQNLRQAPFVSGKSHQWQKEASPISYWLAAFSKRRQVVFDPFTGSGTVPAVCKQLGRSYLAFEIDPDTAETARQRVRETQPPLFVPETEQAEMELTRACDP